MLEEKVENCLWDCKKLIQLLEEEENELSNGLSGDVMDEYRKVVSKERKQVLEIIAILENL